MEQTAINFDKPALTPQAQRLYERLLSGPVTNAAIRDELRLLEYRRRKFEVKKYVEPERTIIKTFLGNGIVEYKLINVR